MRILIVSEPGIDGVFRHVEGLIHFLHGLDNCHLDFAYSSKRGSAQLSALIQKVESNGGETLDLKTGNSPSFTDLSAYRRLYAFAKRRRPSVTHAHSSKAGALARLLPQSVSDQVFYTPHAYYGLGNSGGVKTLLFNSIERFLGPRGINIHLSPEESQFAEATLYLRPDGHVSIPNAVDFAIFREVASVEERAVIRQSLGLPEDAAVIGSIGRLSYQKNPELLYRAFARFAEQRDQAEPLYLLHVGNGSDSEMREIHQLAVELGITDQVVRPAYRSDPEIFYRAMDAFCLSSRYEGLPFTGLEALAANLPLILTDAPGLQSFGDSGYGLSHVFYGKANEQSLAGAMGAWFMKRTLPVNHRLRAQKHFSIPEVYGKILKLYEDYSTLKV
jgi:glycosyltransferase involved in cell wall biosynthesis